VDDTEKLEVYRAQTQNVRALNRAWKQMNRTINHSLRKGDHISAQAHTKALVLVFCAWSEAFFSKLIHTPYGFTNDEIDQIKHKYQQDGLEASWVKCLELALRKVSSNPKRSNYIPNIRQRLLRTISQYVTEPRILRNKIAHGQWEVALNREQTAVNADISAQIQEVDVVRVRIWYEVFGYLAAIVECLIESPDRAFQRDYWIVTAELEQFLDDTRDWSLGTKVDHLKHKPLRETQG